jgi:RNA recognition motif-containing protein
MSTKLYVGNLGNLVTEQELSDLFSPFGEILSVRIIKDRFTNESRGFGFVEMVNGEDAKTAINDVNGTDFHDKKVIVNEARPPQERRVGGGRGGFGGGGSRGGFGGGRGDGNRYGSGR